MKFATIAAAVLSLASVAAAQNKIAVIHIQQAMVTTDEGQKAATGLQAKFEPRKKELEEKQRQLQQKQAELSKGSNTMAEAKRLSLTRDIDSMTKSLQRDSQDAQDEFEQEQNRILGDLGQKMMVVIDKYAKDNGYAVVIDVSSQQTPVLWAASSVDITKDIVDLYNKNSPGAPAAAAPAATPKPAAPAPKPAPKK
ncbi:MAG: OmpH family outer membrane protein [Bryobacteraceae bacterium]